MISYDELIIKRAGDTSALSNFYCGIKAMDNFIHDKSKGLETYVKGHLTNLWIVFNKITPIAFFSLSKSNVVINTFDKNQLLKNDSFLPEYLLEVKTYYPSVEIDYLGVKEDYRHQGIGEFLMAAITKKVMEDNLSATLFISLDAYHTTNYSTVNFYKKCGFFVNDYGLLQNLNKERDGEIPQTIRMNKPLLYT